MSNRVLITVMLCCNDHRNGMFQGFVEQIEVGDRSGDIFLAMDGYCRMSDGPVEIATPSGERRRVIRVGRFQYGVRGYSEWFGNWCWDLARLTSGDAARLLNNLRASGRWSPHEGHSWAWDRWKSGEPFTAEDLV